MIKFLSSLINLNAVLTDKIQAIQVYDEALAFHTAKEYAKAAPLIKKAAELGNVNAMAMYGSALLLGRGVKENGPEAVKWLEMAVAHKNQDAVGLLGMAWATGKAGIKPNHKLARELLNQAVASGDTQSAELLNMMDKKIGIFKKLKG